MNWNIYSIPFLILFTFPSFLISPFPDLLLLISSPTLMPIPAYLFSLCSSLISYYLFFEWGPHFFSFETKSSHSSIHNPFYFPSQSSYSTGIHNLSVVSFQNFSSLLLPYLSKPFWDNSSSCTLMTSLLSLVFTLMHITPIILTAPRESL